MEDVMAGPAREIRRSQPRLMVAACAGMFVFGIVMAVLGAVLPSLFGKIRFSKAAAGDLFPVPATSRSRTPCEGTTA